MKTYHYLIIALLLLTCAALAIRMQVVWDGLLILMLLFIPLFDRQWNKQEAIKSDERHIYSSIAVVLIIAAIAIAISTDNPEVLVRTLFFVAIPEEWFFRAYLMTRLGGGHKANVISSIAFSLLHALTRGWFVGLLVFLPSLVFGWLYHKTRNYYLVTAAHAVSNIVYISYL